MIIKSAIRYGMLGDRCQIYFIFSKKETKKKWVNLNLLYISFSMIFISLCISSLHLCLTDVIKKTKLKMILVIERGNYVNMQQWGIIKEIRTQKGPFQVKSPLTPNNAHFMHCNSAPPLMVKNALQWAIWLPPTRGIELSVE